MTVRLFAAGITASIASRTIAGPVVAYGVPGRTSRGMLKVRPGALYIDGPVHGVKLTKEHIREESRGHATSIDFLPEGIRASMRVSDGPEGDAALQEALDKTRDGFSFDVIDEEIVGDELVSGRIIAIGQVGIPAYDGMRIDSIAASLHDPTHEGAPRMTPEERARLAELVANTARTPEEETEFQALTAKAVAEATAVQAASDPEADDVAGGGGSADPEDVVEETPAPAGVAASIPSVPGGQPTTQRTATRTQPRSAFQRMVDGLARAFTDGRNGGNVLQGVTAALSDITSTAHTDNIERKGWQGELFDGVDYTPVWSDLLNSGPLDNWEGQGWGVTSVPAMADYAGDKAAIPSGLVVTRKEEWEAARAAIGMDIDRKFFDFKNADFLAKVFREVGLTYLDLLDTKSRAFVLAEAVKSTKTVAINITNADATITFTAGTITAADVGASISGTNIPGGATILSYTDATHAELSANATATGARTATIDVQANSVLKAAGRLALSLNRKGPADGSKAPSNTGADWIMVNDEDMFTLMDIDADSVPAFLDLFKIKPEDFRSDPTVPRGTVLGGVRKAAQLLTPPNQPIEVDALNLALGGVDKAFFAYWAILQHHPRGIQSTKFVPAA